MVSFIAIFAALYFVLSILPGIPVIGLPAMTMELEASIASVFGIILGPYIGTLAAFYGTLAAFFYGGASPSSLMFIFNPAFNALTVGLIFRNKWKISFVLFAAVIVAFWFTPVSTPLNENWYVALAATFDKIIAMLLIIPIAIMLKKRNVLIDKLQLKPLGESFLLVFLVSFVGNQADSALGGLLFALPPFYAGVWGITDVGIVRGLFLVSPFVYIAVRLLQAFIATFIGLPLIKALRALKVEIWP